MVVQLRPHPPLTQVIKMGPRIKKVKVLQGKERDEAEMMRLNPEDLVLITDHIEKIYGNPVSWLIKHSKE